MLTGSIQYDYSIELGVLMPLSMLPYAKHCAELDYQIPYNFVVIYLPMVCYSFQPLLRNEFD